MHAITTSPHAFEIPPADASDFARLPADTRARVRWLLTCMRTIAASTSKTKACHEIAAAAGMHFNTIYQSWSRYRTTLDWRVLIDRRKTSEFWQRDPAKQIGLPHEFIQHWKTLIEQNDRAAKPAYSRLIRDWRAWSAGDTSKKIPGYTHPPIPPSGARVPRGWTYSNLLNHQPSDLELAAARRGRTTAKKLLPGVITTRVGSYPFAEIQFDDMFHDFRVIVPGYQKTYNLLEFGCVDRYTTYIFRPGLKPRLRDMDTGKMKHLNSRDFHLFLVNWLLEYGWHPDGTVFNVENATASISRPFQEKLLMWSGGRLTVSRAGMSGAPAYIGGWKERAKGNPDAKALKEGLGKLIHGALAHLPGQVGPSYDLAPASDAGRTIETEFLLALSAQVPALREKLSLGHLELADAVYAINTVYDQLNTRHDHQIEGWEEIGGVIRCLRPLHHTGHYIPLTSLHSLPEPQRVALSAAMAIDPTLVAPHRLSPAEMLVRQDVKLLKPPHEAIPDLLGPEYGHTKPVTAGLITITSPGLGTLRYKAEYQDASGFRRRLPNGSDVLLHLNPWRPDFVYLSEPRTQRFLGIAPRHLAVTQNDIEAIHHAHGRAERDYKDAVAEVVARHGLARLPHLQKNTRILRESARPSPKETALQSAGFDPASMLDPEDPPSVISPPISRPPTNHTSITLDPADLL